MIDKSRAVAARVQQLVRRGVERIIQFTTKKRLLTEYFVGAGRRMAVGLPTPFKSFPVAMLNLRNAFKVLFLDYKDVAPNA